MTITSELKEAGLLCPGQHTVPWSVIPPFLPLCTFLLWIWGWARKATVSLSYPSCCQMSSCHLPTELNHLVLLPTTHSLITASEKADLTQWGRLGEAGGGGLAEAPENCTPLSFHWHGELWLGLSTPASDTLLCQAGQRFQCAVKAGWVGSQWMSLHKTPVSCGPR